jgi:hypothetical protein
VITHFLIFLHLVLLVVAIAYSRRKGLGRLRAMNLPVALGFAYLAVIQGSGSARRLPPDFTAETVQGGLTVSLVAFLAFTIGYALRTEVRPTTPISAATTNFRRLGMIATVLSIIGLIGLASFIVIVGGLSSYAGSADWVADPYQTSGYLLNMKMALYPAVALFVILIAYNQATKFQCWYCLTIILIILADGISATDRGDSIRGAILLGAWVILGINRASGLSLSLSTRIMTAVVPLLLTIPIALMLPAFRGQGRKLSASETTWEEAMTGMMVSKGDFRGAERGGEFDAGARIYDWVAKGNMEITGPVHFLRVAWNMVPRAWVPAKHEIFERFAGPSYQKLRFEATSYLGCAPNGWGEAYGTMGWFGVLGYFGLFGYGIRWAEGQITSLGMGLLMAGVWFIPLLQYVVMDFWAGTMNTLLTVVPLWTVLWACRTPKSAQSDKRKRRRAPQTSVRNLAPN